MVVGLGNSLGWKEKVNGSYGSKMRRTTYVEVSIVEASPDTVTSLDLERWKAISLGD
jgi:hypothetical protein